MRLGSIFETECIACCSLCAWEEKGPIADDLERSLRLHLGQVHEKFLINRYDISKRGRVQRVFEGPNWKEQR